MIHHQRISIKLMIFFSTCYFYFHFNCIRNSLTLQKIHDNNDIVIVSLSLEYKTLFLIVGAIICGLSPYFMIYIQLSETALMM
jgi:hypothetical protein